MLLKDIKEEIQRYRQIQERLNELRPKEIAGFLEIKHKGNKAQYYHCKWNSVTGKKECYYIKKSNAKLARDLAWKYYHKKIEKYVSQRLSRLEVLFKEYEKEDLDSIYENLPKARRQLFNPIIATKKKSLEEWLCIEYQAMIYGDRDLIQTQKGDLVRSKSEKILADLFFSLKIPYKYECPLVINERIVAYPDFTFFNPRTQQEIYWEHFGMMDTPEYANRALEKLRIYANYNILPGQNLIVSFESNKHGPDFQAIKKLIDSLLIESL